MKKDKGILKKKGSPLKIGIITFISTLVVVNGSAAIIGNVTLKDYSNNAQIVEIAKELDCDTNYISEHSNKFLRLQHNGDEPIYVHIDEQLNETQRQCAINSLDYLFGLVGEINPNYRYKLLSKGEFNKKILKTRISISLDDTKYSETGTKGNIDSTINPFSHFTSKRTTYKHEIYQSRDYQTDDMSELEYVYGHELFHAFGIKDVYITNSNSKLQGNTYIKSTVGEKVGILTPNDYKCLISLYADKFDSASEKASDMEKYKEMAYKYEENYYKHLAGAVKEEYNITENLNNENFKWQGRGEFKSNIDQNVYVFYYNIKIKDNVYDFEVLDENKNPLDAFSGDCVYHDGAFILKNVQLKQGLTPGAKGCPNGFIQDLIMVKSGVAMLVDMADNLEVLGFSSKLYPSSLSLPSSLAEDEPEMEI